MDLNGTLLVRNRISWTSTNRPHVVKFLEYCLKYHRVALWSSLRSPRERDGHVVTPVHTTAGLSACGDLVA
jgi:hypothetical protein